VKTAATETKFPTTIPNDYNPIALPLNYTFTLSLMKGFIISGTILEPKTILAQTYKGIFGATKGGITVARAPTANMSDTVIFLPNRSYIMPPKSNTGIETNVAYVIELVNILDCFLV
jgi:hypothetical protein